MLGVFVYNMVTGHRCLIIVIRKSELCKCGCRGWCTLHVAFEYIHWCAAVSASGEFPAQRFGGADFDPVSEDFRVARATTSLGGIFCFLVMKGDWAEFQVTFGFPTFSSLYSPCPLCFAPKEMFVLRDGFSVVNFPYALKTFRDYNQFCDSCEIVVVLNQQLHLAIRGRLAYDKRSGKAAKFGRVLMEAVPLPGGEGLRAGDRLEPSLGLMDVGEMFDKLDTFPKTVKFWRIPAHVMSHHRNPLFDEELGITPQRIMGIDGLHTLALGVFLFLLPVRRPPCFQTRHLGYTGAHRRSSHKSINRPHENGTQGVLQGGPCEGYLSFRGGTRLDARDVWNGFQPIILS